MMITYATPISLRLSTNASLYKAAVYFLALEDVIALEGRVMHNISLHTQCTISTAALFSGQLYRYYLRLMKLSIEFNDNIRAEFDVSMSRC